MSLIIDTPAKGQCRAARADGNRPERIGVGSGTAGCRHFGAPDYAALRLIQATRARLHRAMEWHGPEHR